MKLRMFAILFLLAVATCSVGCDAGANKPSNEPVVQDLEIETGEAFAYDSATGQFVSVDTTAIPVAPTGQRRRQAVGI